MVIKNNFQTFNVFVSSNESTYTFPTETRKLLHAIKLHLKAVELGIKNPITITEKKLVDKKNQLKSIIEQSKTLPIGNMDKILLMPNADNNILYWYYNNLMDYYEEYWINVVGINNLGDSTSKKYKDFKAVVDNFNRQELVEKRESLLDKYFRLNKQELKITRATKIQDRRSDFCAERLLQLDLIKSKLTNFLDNEPALEDYQRVIDSLPKSIKLNSDKVIKDLELQIINLRNQINSRYGFELNNKTFKMKKIQNRNCFGDD
jgi:hypothetical protein